MSQDTLEGPTGELFEAKPGTYEKLLAGSARRIFPRTKNDHVWAVPPRTKFYTTKHGLTIEIPDI